MWLGRRDEAQQALAEQLIDNIENFVAGRPSNLVLGAYDSCLRHVRGRLEVVGAGNASAAMATAFEKSWPGDLSGLVVTRRGYAQPCRRIEIVEAAHPVPDGAGFTTARRMLDLVTGHGADDLVVCLLSGGGSALLSHPAAGLTLEDKQAVNCALLASGATIAEINCVRRHLSAVKGGRLAVACRPARVLTLAISDVPGDDPADVASGPTVGDQTTCIDALAILDRYKSPRRKRCTSCWRAAEARASRPMIRASLAVKCG